jgi:hypothetical protein
MTNLLVQPAPGPFTTIADLEALTANLEVIADWRDDLVRKICRVELRFELCGLDGQEQEQLTQEVFAFTSLCRALADTLRRANETG